MIKVQCVTNVDKLRREVWPTELACRPMIDEGIQSKSGYRGYITIITHCTRQVDKIRTSGGLSHEVRSTEPYLELYISIVRRN